MPGEQSLYLFFYLLQQIISTTMSKMMSINNCVKMKAFIRSALWETPLPPKNQKQNMSSSD